MSGVIHDELWIMCVRLVLATVLSGVVGLEREIKNQHAGLRTHLLVGMGSCMLMLLSIYGFEQFIEQYPNADLTRIPAYVISGLGFLGAGAILKNEEGIRGLTTAASLWVVAGIGLLVGVGMYSLAVFATFLVFITLFLLKKWERWL